MFKDFKIFGTLNVWSSTSPTYIIKRKWRGKTFYVRKARRKRRIFIPYALPTYPML